MLCFAKLQLNLSAFDGMDAVKMSDSGAVFYGSSNIVARITGQCCGVNTVVKLAVKTKMLLHSTM